MSYPTPTSRDATQPQKGNLKSELAVVTPTSEHAIRTSKPNLNRFFPLRSSLRSGYAPRYREAGDAPPSRDRQNPPFPQGKFIVPLLGGCSASRWGPPPTGRPPLPWLRAKVGTSFLFAPAPKNPPLFTSVIKIH